MKNKVIFTAALLDYKGFTQYSDTFLETGTAAGDGVQRALDAGFMNVASCEAAPQWFEQSFARFKEYKGGTTEDGKAKPLVTIHKLKSTNFLSMFVSQAFPQVIFLDAHPAGPLSAGHDDVVEKGLASEFHQYNIIKAELAIILKKFNQHVIIIDDVNGLTDGYAMEYMDLMAAANPGYEFSFWDENLSKNPAYYYKDKILVGVPK